MPALKNPRHEAFAQAFARGMSASAAYGQVRVAELQEEQLVIHQQATAAAAANSEAARAKAMSERGGAAAAVSALTAKANLDPRRIKPLRLKSIAWRADGCPVHRWNGTLRYLCKQAKRKSAH